MKVLVLVLGARARPYPALVQAIKQTWASISVDDIETIFYFGGNATDFVARDLTLDVSDGASDIGRKTIACFAWCLRHRDFDLVFRTNCSSYVDLPNLRRYVQGNARTRRYYAGLIGTGSDGFAFASGAGYFLSRDLVELVVREKSRWRHDLIDDQAIARLLAVAGVRPEAAPRLDIRALNEVSEADLSHYHFRCRTLTRRRRGDARVMRALHRAFSEARGVPRSPARDIAERLLRR